MWRAQARQNAVANSISRFALRARSGGVLDGWSGGARSGRDHREFGCACSGTLPRRRVESALAKTLAKTRRVEHGASRGLISCVNRLVQFALDEISTA